MINWTKSVNSQSQDGLIGCNLESPKTTPETGDIIFKGWVLHETPIKGVILRAGSEIVAHLPGLTPRPDVVKARAKNEIERTGFLYSGFSLTTPFRHLPYRISLLLDDKEVAFLDVKPQRHQAEVLLGHNGYLFLAGDSNDSLGQFTGATPLPHHALAGWRHNFNRMKNWEKIYDLTSAFVIAPVKEEILPEFYPYKRAQSTPLDQFIEGTSGEKFILPRIQLMQARHYAYSRTDTHWTDIGATLTARLLLDYWNLGEDAVRALPSAYSLKPFVGDLGAKLTPVQSEYSLTFAEGTTSARSFHNGVMNNGDIHVYATPDAPVQGTCIVFGDSFGVNFSAALSGVFTRLIYTYRPAAFDTALVELEKPKYVVLQINQRFLVGQTDFRKTIFETAAAKVRSLPQDRRDKIVSAWSMALSGRNHAIAKALIEAYQHFADT